MVLQDKVVLVTGAASGLGAAIATQALSAGALVAMLDRQAAKLRDVALSLPDARERVLSLEVDLLDRSAMQACVAQVADHFGGLDVLVNNAGTDVTASMQSLDLDDWDRVIATNLSAPFALSKLALPLLVERRGQIVNIASTAALRAWPNASAYHASKWGVRGLSHALHAELREVGVRVMCVVAGGMRTPFLLDRFDGLDLDRLQDPMDVAQVIVMALGTPRGSAIPELLVLPERESSWP